LMPLPCWPMRTAMTVRLGIIFAGSWQFSGTMIYSVKPSRRCYTGAPVLTSRVSTVYVLRGSLLEKRQAVLVCVVHSMLRISSAISLWSLRNNACHDAVLLCHGWEHPS